MSVVEKELSGGSKQLAALCVEYIQLCETGLGLCLDPAVHNDFPAFCSALQQRCNATIAAHCTAQTDAGSSGPDAGPVAPPPSGGDDGGVPPVSGADSGGALPGTADAGPPVLGPDSGPVPPTSPPGSAGWPTAPPAKICGNSALLAGPASAPQGAIVVPAGNNSSVDFGKAGATYWFAPGVHTLGGGAYDQIVPGAGSTYVGGPMLPS